MVILYTNFPAQKSHKIKYHTNMSIFSLRWNQI